MTRRAGWRWTAGWAFGLATVVTAGPASAHGDTDADRPSPPPAPASPSAAPAPPAAPHEEKAESESEGEEERFSVGLDLVLGWGKVPFAVQNLPANGNPNITYTRADQVQANVQSFILTATAEVARHVEVEARIPFSFAGFTPDGSAARQTTDFGNVELAGEYAVPLRWGMRLALSLGVALPTAQGDEIPTTLVQTPSAQVDETAYDRFSLARAAAFARGYEDNALFEGHRLGIVPKVSLLYRMRGLSIEPWVKVENLVATTSSLDAQYVGELVGGLRVGYWVQKMFELALRGWVNGGYAGTDEDKQVSVALEPQVVLRFGPVLPYAGVIIPVAGPPEDNSFFGVRVGAVGHF